MHTADQVVKEKFKRGVTNHPQWKYPAWHPPPPPPKGINIQRSQAAENCTVQEGGRPMHAINIGEVAVKGMYLAWSGLASDLKWATVFPPNGDPEPSLSLPLLTQKTENYVLVHATQINLPVDRSTLA